jgi:hypothetical protein
MSVSLQHCIQGSRTGELTPNPSFKGEAQRHGTLAIKRRGLRPHFSLAVQRAMPLGSPLTRTLDVMIRAILISIVLVVGGCTTSLTTLFLPVEVATPEAANRVPMGLPIAFVWQDMTRYDPPSWPNTYRFYAPQEHHTSVHLLWFTLSVAFFTAILGGIALTIRLALHRQRGIAAPD